MEKHFGKFYYVIFASLLLLGSSLVVQTQATPTWSIQSVDSSGTIGMYSSLALDSSGNPHISYRNGSGSSTPGYLKYASWNGSAWNIQNVDSGGNVWRLTSLALDKISGYPRISYYESGHGFKYAEWNGSAWNTEIFDSAATNPIYRYSSLALDSAGNPHISYCHGAGIATNNLTYAERIGGDWHFQTVDSNNMAWWSSLALDSSGNPHISYSTSGYAPSLRYAEYTGLGWQTQTLDAGVYSSLDLGAFSSLALDSSGNPYISYEANPNYLKYAMLCATVASVWTTDASGNPKVSFNSESVYVHWQADGAVNITVRYQDGTVDKQWLNQGTNGNNSFSPSHGNGFYNINFTACTQQTMIAYGSFFFVPEYALGTLMALAAPLLAALSFHTIQKRKKKTLNT
jgi:hypothetical protein